ncbi:putative bifunctional diguanylate cyclase/phosphodiesterase [Arsenicitalea aurantiaca]|uniref:putative bifunctional diguanylate cyclase/phosphodiesterase n=1 Tax=Arsenicitalea aurantiaca TaxID=1783274 RepID=UPI001315559C|nr:EAL domain-containing protein [Arsenicitalea aurantiaca]
MQDPTRAEDAREHALLLNAALESIPYGFCVWGSDFRLVMWNRHWRELYGFPEKAVSRGVSLAEVVALSARLGNHPDVTPEAFLHGYTSELLANRGGARAKSRERLLHGRVIETAHVYAPGLGWVVTHEDVTEEIAADEIVQERKRRLEVQNLRFDAAVNNISQGLSMFDRTGRLVICNGPFAAIYGLPAEMVRPGTELEDILGHLFARGMYAEADQAEYMAWRRQVIASGSFAKTVHELDGRIILMQHHPMADGGWVSTHEDVTEQRENEARIRYLARHDALTGLPNRAQFLDAMGEAEKSLGRGHGFAVLCIDLDHFKAVNDTLGHAAGDRVLREVAGRLSSAVREGDLLARIGGDEFSLLMHEVDQPGDAATVAERIIEAMTPALLIDGHQALVGASVGIAMAPADGATTDVLLKNADLALYRAKMEARSAFRFFEPEMDAAMQKRRTIEAGLRQALERDEMRLVFQPLVGLAENRVTCFEALLRWELDGQIISPADFVPIAEETGLIVSIGEWVLRRACAVAAGWPEDVRVAVNLSPVQFKNRGLFDIVQSALAASGLSPRRLELEITESLLLAENDQTLETLHRLRAEGVRISMDDFGTGYSSLSYLRSFPFDKIKIDRSFMRDLSKTGGDLAIIKAVIGLGQSLGMSTTAEGVETQEQLDAVREQGCSEVQGFLFSPPLPEGAVAAFLSGQADEETLRAAS